ALPLLDRIAPEVERPLAYRQGGQPPTLVRVAEEDLLAAALREAADLDGLLAVIAPRSLAAVARSGAGQAGASAPEPLRRAYAAVARSGAGQAGASAPEPPRRAYAAQPPHGETFD